MLKLQIKKLKLVFKHVLNNNRNSFFFKFMFISDKNTMFV